MKGLTLAVFTIVSMALGATASAASAYTQGVTHLRAGPSAEYPIVATLPPGTVLGVNGCLDDYSWCDVDWAGNHGWVYGDYVFFDYQNRRVPVLQFGASLGIGIVGFTLGDYWGRYYVGRPWYGRRDYWMHRPLPPRRPPPPRPRPPGPRPPVTPPRPPRPNPGPGPRPPRPQPSKPQPPGHGKPPSPGRPGNGGPGNGGPGNGRPGQGGPGNGRPGPGGPGNDNRPPPGN